MLEGATTAIGESDGHSLHPPDASRLYPIAAGERGSAWMDRPDRAWRGGPRLPARSFRARRGALGPGGAPPRPSAAPPGQARALSTRPLSAYAAPSVRAIEATTSGPTRQQPPISRAPDSRQRSTSSAANVERPRHARVSASQTSPLLG